MKALSLVRHWAQQRTADRQKRSALIQVRGFQPKLEFRFESQGYVVRTAKTPQDLLEVLTLRHEVFVEEWQGQRHIHSLDIDDYDSAADHILIQNEISGEVVGTYRVLSSQFASSFYSENEFYLGEFLALPGSKLELGRACIKSTHRNGQAIDLLWRGLARYIELSHSRYLFGCGSVRVQHAELVRKLIHHLAEQSHLRHEYGVKPTSDYEHPDIHTVDSAEMSVQQVKRMMPPLLRSYLQAGAKVHGMPAWDLEFECFDFFTVLDMREIDRRFFERYFERPLLTVVPPHTIEEVAL